MILTGLAFLVGGLASLLGVVLVGGYVWEAVILRIGDPDQSLLFWYLPLLFIGMLCFMIGIALIRYALKRHG